MHRLQDLFHQLTHSYDPHRGATLAEAIGAVEAALTAPEISRERAEHALHRLTAEMLLRARAGHLH